MEQYRKRRQQKKDGEPISEKEENLYNYKEEVTDKPHVTLQEMPDNERNKAAAEIAGKKILELIDILKIHHEDVTKNGYFFKELKDQQEYILGLEALIKLLEPTADNKFIQGDWKDMFEPLAERLRIENHWSEDPEFIRDHRWQIFGDGTVENRYKYTNAHILGGSIIPKINNVILISECFPFLKAFFKNHFETKYHMLQHRSKEMKKRVKMNGKT